MTIKNEIIIQYSIKYYISLSMVSINTFHYNQKNKKSFLKVKK